jgi:hypothetical protein
MAELYVALKALGLIIKWLKRLREPFQYILVFLLHEIRIKLFL